MRPRLAGQETEYGIRFSPSNPGGPAPSKEKLVQALFEGIRQVVKTRPGSRNWIQPHLFVENGGSFNYERPPGFPLSGLLEGSTPECVSPRELILYQRAQEQLLLQAIPHAETVMRDLGFEGGIGLLKNCRDAEGNYYGGQENYESPIARGLSLWVYRILLLLILPIQILLWIVTGLSILLILMLVWGSIFGMAIFRKLLERCEARSRSSFLKKCRRLYVKIDRRLDGILDEERFQVLLRPVEVVQYWIFITGILPFTLLLRALAFRSQRRALEAFMVSRIIFTGAGRLERDGTFVLSEKASGLKRLTRLTCANEERTVFDSANLHKPLFLGAVEVLLFRTASFRSLFSRLQRFQIGFSDSNRCQTAEYLKVGTTSLVLAMIEAGFLKTFPRLSSPLRSLQLINADLSLSAKVKLKNGQAATALELQRLYLERAKQFLAVHPGFQADYSPVIELWETTLDWLAIDPGLLIGRLDWVSKRYLLSTAGAGESEAVRKKIDLAYHELGCGYYDELEKNGIAPSLVERLEVAAAVVSPSAAPEAKLRWQFIHGEVYAGQTVVLDWSYASVGKWWRRKTLWFSKLLKSTSAS